MSKEENGSETPPTLSAQAKDIEEVPLVEEVSNEDAAAAAAAESEVKRAEEIPGGGTMAVDKVPSEGKKEEKKDDGEKKDDTSSEHSSKDSISTDESSFHASDYEDDAGFDPDKDPSDMIAKATVYKEEGNTHFKNADVVRASRSYKKGVSLLRPINQENTGDEQVKALLVILLTNLSMCALKNNKPKLALDVATKAIEVDDQNVKAFYRRAMAHKKLGDLKEAKKDLKKAVQIDPNNKPAKKELHTLVKYMTETAKREKKAAQAFFSFENKSMSLYGDKEEELRKKKEEEERKKREKEEALKKRKQQWEDENVKRMAVDKSALSFEEWDKLKKKEEKRARKAKRAEEDKKKKEAEEKRNAERAAKKAARKKEEEDDGVDDDALSERELASLRGYKKTPDGRTTSYFSREQSLKEKELIGDITPQRLDVNGESVSTSGPARLSPSAESGKAQSGSAWNKAGTWEEKNTTDWCSSQLKARLEESASAEGGCVSVVTEIPEFSGDASVAVAGGKKRYIFDFHCKLNFNIRHSDSDEVIASGSFQLPDINSGSHEELEINSYAWTTAPSEEYDEAAKNCRLSLITSVRESVKQFVCDFNAHY